MQNFLQSLLSLTVGGSVLTAALLLLGRVKKLPKSFYYYAWLLVLLRLALPLPGSLNLSVPQPLEPLVVSNPNLVWVESIEWNQDFMEPVETTPVRPYLDVKETPDPIRPTYGNPKIMDVWAGLGILWLMGFAVFLGRDLIGYFRFRHALKKTLLPPKPSDLAGYNPGAHGPKLLRSPGLDSPMLMGIARPVLLLPDRDYDPEILDCIFRHELTHYRRGDILLKWLAMPILAAHWFNPLTILIRREFHRSCELSCDERILKTMDHDQRKCYGQTLLVMAQPGEPARTALSTSFCAEKRNLKERLVHIMNFGPKSRWILAVTALLLVGIMAACLALGPAREKAVEEIQETAPAPEPVETTVPVEHSYQSLGMVPQVYTGETVHAQAHLRASKDVWENGLGLLLLLDGRPQPYRIEEGGELRYMHVFRDLTKGKNIDVIFDPVTGHEGETLDLSLFTIKNPNRPTGEPFVPFNHSEGSLTAMSKLMFTAEPGETAVPAVTRLEKNVNISMEEASDQSYQFQFAPGARLDGKQKFQAKFSGPKDAHLSYVIYLNNEPVAWEHFFAIKGKQRVAIDTTLDLSEVQGSAMIYAVLYGKNPNNPADNFWEISDTYYITAPRQDQAVPDKTVETNVMSAANVDEFLAAIGPDTTIFLKEGLYDLTAASSYGQKNVSDYYRWEKVRDGYALTIQNVDNLVIFGEDTETCRLVTQPRYAPVVSFGNCTGVNLRGLTIGHTQGVEGCNGAVLALWCTNDVSARACDLYGCGTFGIEAYDSRNITVANSVIRDCSNGAAWVQNCVDVFLNENKIHGIGKLESDNAVPAALFQVHNSSNSAVLNCQITDSTARKLLYTDNSQQTLFLGNTGTKLDIRDGAFASFGSAPTVADCQLKFQDETKWIADGFENDYVYSVQGEPLYGEDLDQMKYKSWPLPVALQEAEQRLNAKTEEERLENALKRQEQLEKKDQ